MHVESGRSRISLRFAIGDPDERGLCFVESLQLVVDFYHLSPDCLLAAVLLVMNEEHRDIERWAEPGFRAHVERNQAADEIHLVSLCRYLMNAVRLIPPLL